jgi:putative PIG3 family NAD(P)H quinone oxidoreductase
MRAVVLREHGGPEVLRTEEVPDPVPGPEEVVVEVVGSAVNRADVLQRMGLYASPVSMAHEIPGLELAGRVARVGPRAGMWQPGDAVMGIVAAGGYAEEVAVHERQLMPVPSGVPLADAAAIPEVFITAWDGLVMQGGLTSGRWALVHAGASGVGTAAIQLAHAIGARVAVTCSAGKMDACRALGADLVLERSPHDWLTDAQAHVPDGFDAVLDSVGGEELARNVEAVARGGRIVQIGTMGGGAASINLGPLIFKRASLHGTVLRGRPLEEKIAVTRRFAVEVVPLFETGAVRPVIDSRFPLDQVADAHRHMEANANVGKILLDVRSA